MWAKDSIQQVKERSGIVSIETVHVDPSLSCLHACGRKERRERNAQWTKDLEISPNEALSYSWE